ncbi:MAG TPA: hypothetical protein DEQ34_02130 [Balneolaceae bacterium]|nr:hypothetical protein [Balneolaceae bacterium]|tara:strand:+ start:21324 stop:22307 length:984 start_codon:yes stop_codon:yes gene_type:complete
MDAQLYETEHIQKLITSGKKLILAGDEAVLKKLPRGNWIAGTIPYFMDKDGGKFSKEMIYATVLPDYIYEYNIVVYNQEQLQNVYKDAYTNGFSVIILPGSSDIHYSFSLNSPKYPNFAVRPLVGWVAGTDLDEVGMKEPKVFDGVDPMGFEDSAVVMHVGLPPSKVVDIDIVNIFEPGDGDELRFPVDGFFAKDVIVNGERKNFAEYIRENNIDTKLPLVADTYGTMVNTSFQRVEEHRVFFYAPVFADTTYRIAKPFNDYVQEFEQMTPDGLGEKTFFSCNCILNYLYAELEGKQTIGFTGPVTFGEVAYQLLNQTMVYLTIDEN